MAIVSIVPLFVHAESLTETYTISFSDLDYEYYVDSIGLIHIDPADKTLGFLGGHLPALPLVSKKIAIPGDRKYVSLSYSLKKRLKIPRCLLADSPLPVNPEDSLSISEVNYIPLSGSEKNIDICFQNGSENNLPFSYKIDIYPHENVEYVSSSEWDNVVVLNFVVCPFIFDAINPSLYFIDSIDLTIETEDRIIPESPHVLCLNPGYLKGAVLNPKDLGELSLLSPDSEKFEERVDYLIVTNESLKNAFIPLIKWKREKGLYSKIITMEEIDAKYSGSSSQLKLKRCLQDFNRNNSLKYVLLGGDHTVVPIKKCYGKVFDGKQNYVGSIPTDLFYSCFNEPFDWDGNGNGVCGELEDNVDLTQFINLTRLPVHFTYDVDAFVEKLISYEKFPEYSHNLLMGGAQVGSERDPNYSYDQRSDANIFGEMIYNGYIFPYWRGQCDRFYDTYTSFPGGSGYDFNRLNLIEKINSGYSFINIDTHGTLYNFNLERNEKYYGSDACRQNTSTFSIITTSACNTNGFDVEWVPCLSQDFIVGRNNGVVAYVGCSRSGWGSGNYMQLGASDKFTALFYKNLFSSNIQDKNFGAIVNVTKSDLVSYYKTDEAIRWIMYGINPIGDPEMPIYISEPKEFDNCQVNFISTDEFRCDTGTPDCRVCVMNVDWNGEIADYYEVFDNVQQVHVKGHYVNKVVITKPGYYYRLEELLPRVCSESKPMFVEETTTAENKIVYCSPNPTYGDVYLKYEINENVQSAKIVISSLSGTYENAISINPCEDGININLFSVPDDIYNISFC